jgi:hypothetical protein
MKVNLIRALTVVSLLAMSAPAHACNWWWLIGSN